ncbi:VC0807 family protein [Nocardia altamirensis]|uniref:VC0807 family protein n=1 Tax=Nocardia altamirensis TaxID=472158 RepID=UPI00083FEEF1|nr:VC0807 family protein [Nocardia altamirensis]
MKRDYAKIAWLVCDIGLSPAAYYLTRALGFEIVASLVTATAVAALWLAVGMIRTRKADGVAFVMMATYALMLAMAAATEDARLILVRDPLISIAIGALFLVSCRTSRPATAYLAQRLHEEEPNAEQDPRYLSGHRVQTVVWGVALVAESALRIGLIFAVPVSVAAGLSPAVELGLTALLIGWTIWYRIRHSHGSTTPGAQDDSSSAAAELLVEDDSYRRSPHVEAS